MKYFMVTVYSGSLEAQRLEALTRRYTSLAITDNIEGLLNEVR